jgi:tetratricopeptide (TPR) repeat protein
MEQSRARTGLSIYMLPDDPASMVAIALEAAEIAVRAGNRALENTNLLNIAETSIYVGLWDEATRAIAELRQRQIGEWHQGWLMGLDRLLASLRGDFARAEDLNPDNSEFLNDVSLGGSTTRLTSSAFSALAKGDLEIAQRDSAEALALDPKGINASTALDILIHAALWRRDLAQVHEALALTQFNRGRAIVATRRTAEAGVAALEGRLDAAAEIYREAIEKWRVLDCVLDLALCELDLVLLLGPSHPDATVGKEARDIFTQLGALPFLQRLNEVTKNN